MSPRLSLAVRTGGLVLPEQGAIAVFNPPASADLSALPGDRTIVVQPFRPDHDAWAARGFDCFPELASDTGRFAASVLFLPRAKALARLLVARAADRTDGQVIIDGAKTDGVDSLLKDIRQRAGISGQLAKAHGKIFWSAIPPDAVLDWQDDGPHFVDGFQTAPGVFSADEIDPASRLLAESLPPKLGRYVADLGAGWGYLAAHVLQRASVETLDLVEADYTALKCARANVTDARARFHWADATTWKPSERPDAVVMNPPFHQGRAADPGLGRAFIERAAHILTPAGSLWIVANRHLPYESTLTAHFAKSVETAGDARFKVLHASRPRR